MQLEEIFSKSSKNKQFGALNDMNIKTILLRYDSACYRRFGATYGLHIYTRITKRNNYFANGKISTMLFHASFVPPSVAFQFLEETIFHYRHTEAIVTNKDTEGFEAFTAVTKKNAVSWDVA
jgi:hypothetical protein